MNNIRSLPRSRDERSAEALAKKYGIQKSDGQFWTDVITDNFRRGAHAACAVVPNDIIDIKTDMFNQTTAIPATFSSLRAYVFNDYEQLSKFERFDFYELAMERIRQHLFLCTLPDLISDHTKLFDNPDFKAGVQAELRYRSPHKQAVEYASAEVFHQRKWERKHPVMASLGEWHIIKALSLR